MSSFQPPFSSLSLFVGLRPLWLPSCVWEHNRHAPASGPLHLQFPLPLQDCMATPSLPTNLYSDVTMSSSCLQCSFPPLLLLSLLSLFPAHLLLFNIYNLFHLFLVYHPLPNTHNRKVSLCPCICHVLLLLSIYSVIFPRKYSELMKGETFTLSTMIRSVSRKGSRKNSRC